MLSLSTVAARTRQPASRIFLALLFLLVCAASYNGFYDKWELRNQSYMSSVLGFDAIANGTAERPYVYRQLVPWAANKFADLVPASVIDRLLATAGKSQQALPDAHSAARIYFVRYATYLAFVAAIYALYRLCWLVTGHWIASLAAALIFALIFPLFMTVGGYFYDHWELLFLVLACLIAVRGNPLWLPLLVIPATLNKESFLAFLPALIPVLVARRGWRTTLLSVGSAAVVSAVLSSLIKAHYAGNPGDTMQWQLQKHLAFLFSLRPYYRMDTFYGIPMPRGFNLINLLLLAALVHRAWPRLPKPFQQSAWIALAINLPLFVLYCATDELRDLSFLYVTLALLLAYYIQSLDKQAR